MTLAQRFFHDRQSPAKEWLGFGILALRIQQSRKIVQALCHIGMIGAQRFFPDRQRPAKECIRLANPSSQTRLECERLGKCNAHSLLVSMSPPLDESRS